jgi:hypothetical protein
MGLPAKKAIPVFALVLLVMIVFGYTVGKDMALRDNAADRAATREATR